MYLKSNKTVTYNDTKTTSKTVLMTGTLEEVYKCIGAEKTKIAFNYTDVDGGVYEHSKYELTDAEKDAIYPLIKDSLPDIDVVGESAYELAKLYEGFKIKMVEEFPELTVADIDIVEEVEE